MIRKKKNGIEWLEFEKLQGIPGLIHGVFLKTGGHEILEIPQIISGNQVHKDTVLHVEGPINADCDGLITQKKGLGLMIRHADCQATIFYDPKNHKIANVHCGWRGNVQNIYAKTIATMGSDPKDLIVCISPSLGPDFSEFINYKQELPEHFWLFQFKPLYFNLWEISRKQLLDAGILPSNLEIASICTYASPDFFSYRRDKAPGKNNATLVALF